MTTISELEHRVATFEARREALTAELNEAQLALAGARDAVVDGKPDAMRRVTANQSTVIALAAALRELDRRIDDTRTARRAAQQAAEREAWMLRLADLARQATAADADYHTALSEANELLTPLGERMLHAYGTQVAARTAFLQTARFEGRSVGDQRALIDEIEHEHGVSLDTLLVPLAGTSSTTHHDRQSNRAEVKPYGRHVAGILTSILGQREYERYVAEQQAQHAARRRREAEAAAAKKRREAELTVAMRREAEQQAQQEAEDRAQAQRHIDSIYRAW